LIRNFRAEPPSKTPSLIATVFGDLVEAYGGEIWLGSLTRLLEPLGINERLVRTSVYRLSQDGSLEGTRIGRRSFYRLSDAARRRVARFDRRIYYFVEPEWDGEWRLLFAGTRGISSDQRAEIRKRMVWLGYGIIAPNVYGHPNAPMEPVWQLLDELGVTQKVTIMRAANFDQSHGLGTREMVRQCFDIDALERDYRAFNKRYRPLARALESEPGHDLESPESSLMLRIMLIHQYRRILLRDPDLPTPLLPNAWSGHEAHRLCAAIYRAVETSSNAHIREVCENRKGPFGKIAARHTGRFTSG
jgi:phenylacetic acid degradation operon negative regulatory protein